MLKVNLSLSLSLSDKFHRTSPVSFLVIGFWAQLPNKISWGTASGKCSKSQKWIPGRSGSMSWVTSKNSEEKWWFFIWISCFYGFCLPAMFFSLFSLLAYFVQTLFKTLAISFSTMTLFTGITPLYGSSLQYAGPATLVWGWVVVSFFTWFVGIAMAEICSSFPVCAFSLFPVYLFFTFKIFFSMWSNFFPILSIFTLEFPEPCKVLLNTTWLQLEPVGKSTSYLSQKALYKILFNGTDKSFTLFLERG